MRAYILHHQETLEPDTAPSLADDKEAKDEDIHQERVHVMEAVSIVHPAESCGRLNVKRLKQA